MILKNVTLRGNEAKHSRNEWKRNKFSGGNLAIIFFNPSKCNSVNIISSTFSDGQAFFGAGMYLIYYSNNCGNRVSLRNSTFFNNTAYEDGGAIYKVLSGALK